MTYAAHLYNNAIVTNHVAQAGAANTITLAVSESAVNDYYNGCTVSIISGTGNGQLALVIGYAGSTRVATIATVGGNWTVNPDNTSHYTIYEWPTWTNALIVASAERMDHIETDLSAIGVDYVSHKAGADHDTHNDARYLGITAKAGDSDKLDNKDSTDFLLATMRDAPSGVCALNAAGTINPGSFLKVAGSTVRNSHNTQVYNTLFDQWEKIKSITVNERLSGTFRVKTSWTYTRGCAGTGHYHLRVYKNGTALGIDHDEGLTGSSPGTGTQNYSEDFTDVLVAGDTLELWLYIPSGTGCTGRSENVELCYDNVDIITVSCTNSTP